MKKSAICRALSEALNIKTDWKVTPHRYDGEFQGLCKVCGDPEYVEGHDCSGPPYDDYFGNEWDSAMLLEAMPFVSLSHYSGKRGDVNSDVPFWGCWTIVSHTGAHADRKHAIVLAACAWKGIEVGEIEEG